MSLHEPPGVVALKIGGLVSVRGAGGTGVSVSVGRIVPEVERPEHMPAVHPLLLSRFDALERR